MISTRLNGKGIYVRRVDGLGRPGIHLLQRVVASLRRIGDGYTSDTVDEYTHISSSAAMESFRLFCMDVDGIFGVEYLRTPNECNEKRFLKINDTRGFPGMVGSIECQYWTAKNCPLDWEGQFKGKEKKPSVVLEGMLDGELWIWHCHVGCPGSMNDLNILDSSESIGGVLRGDFPRAWSRQFVMTLLIFHTTLRMIFNLLGHFL